MDRREHWEGVYRVKGDAELSWFQETPRVSLQLIEGVMQEGGGSLGRIVDVGGGQSELAGDLVSRGVGEVVVLDIAAAAVERGRSRAGAAGGKVKWVVGDVLGEGIVGELGGDGSVDLWHDRAVFHFLVDEADRRGYAAAAGRAVRAGGHMIVATFGPGGPEKCSGLPVRRYDAAGLAGEFGEGFELVGEAREEHRTPWGKGQEFVYVVLRRRG